MPAPGEIERLQAILDADPQFRAGVQQGWFRGLGQQREAQQRLGVDLPEGYGVHDGRVSKQGLGYWLRTTAPAWAPLAASFALPSGGGGGAAAPSVGSTAATAGGEGLRLLGMAPTELAALGLLAAQFFGGRGGNGLEALGEGGQSTINDLLGLQASQARRQDPLHQAVTQLAMNLLPNSAFGAGPNRPLIG